jgi:catechol 2,3-dioxygenase-like lactoylglutathione lyase family enzyme
MAGISGIHHITAIASDPQANLDFYVGVLGLRLVKRTVNFDDPGTYHFYFGDELGRPGTILTFFPWPGAQRGKQGSGFLTATSFIVPKGSLPAWAERLSRLDITVGDFATRFGEQCLSLEDPDGMPLQLVEVAGAENLPAWGDGLPASLAIRGFHSATLSEEGHEATSKLLTQTLGMTLIGQEGNRFRYGASGPQPGRFVDVLCVPDAHAGRLGAGVVHHIAFRAASDDEQRTYQRYIAQLGFNVTPVLDRNYFRSIYFREPGGVLFEIATDAPGFAVDERPEHLGEHLKLPSQYESARERIEGRVLPISVPRVKVPT